MSMGYPVPPINPSRMDCFVADHSPISAPVFAQTCHKTPALISYRVRCGKRNCRCAEGALHGPYWFLRWRSGVTQRRRYVKRDEVIEVARIVQERTQAERRARTERRMAAIQLRQAFRMCRELEREGQW